MSEVSAKPALTKICVLCSVDVSRQSRTKDKDGNYYCDPCLENWKARQNSGNEQPKAQPANATSNALFCEHCKNEFPHSLLLIADDQRVLCKSCDRQAKMLRYLDDIKFGKKWMMTVGLLGIVPITWPIAIPLTIWIVYRFARALSKPAFWPWIVPASLPWVGLLPLVILEGQAIKAVWKTDLLPDDVETYMKRQGEPFRSDERKDFERLVRLNRFGKFMFWANWFLAFALSGFIHHDIGVIGFVGVGVWIWTWNNLRPYRRHLQEFYSEDLFFQDRPSAIYETALLK